MAHSPIFRRDGVFYWRRRIPRALARITGRSHFCRSLRTANPSVARLRGLRFSLAFEETMQEQARKIAAGIQPTRQELNQILVDLYERIIDECKNWAATRPPYLEARGYASMEERNDDKDLQHDLRQNPGAREQYWQNTMEVADYGEAENYLASIIKDRNLSLDPSSKEFTSLAIEAMKVGIFAFRRFQRGMLPEGIDEEVGRLIEGHLQSREAMRDPVAVAPPSPAQQMPMISKAFEEFRTAMEGGQWQGENKADAPTAMKLWLDLEGDCRLDEMAAKAWPFRDKLAKVPRLHGRSAFIGLNAAQAIVRADAIESGAFDPKTSKILERGRKVERLSKKSQNKHLTFFTSFFNWSPIKRFGLGRPFEKILHTKRVMKREQKPTRQPLTNDEVLAIFDSAVWQGCDGPGARSKRGKDIFRDALFWVPLLLAFQGMRLTEALQLWLEDIAEENGLVILRIARGPGRSLKSDAAIRELPLHPMLNRIGFLEYVAERRDNGDLRLFPDYTKGRTGHARTHAFSKWFGNYRRAVGCGGEWKDLHAFRHSVNTCLLRKMFTETLVAYVLGHEGGYRSARPMHMTTEVYFGGYERVQVEGAINAIEYPGLDRLLSPLFTRTS